MKGTAYAYSLPNLHCIELAHKNEAFLYYTELIVNYPSV